MWLSTTWLLSWGGWPPLLSALTSPARSYVRFLSSLRESGRSIRRLTFEPGGGLRSQYQEVFDIGPNGEGELVAGGFTRTTLGRGKDVRYSLKN